MALLEKGGKYEKTVISAGRVGQVRRGGPAAPWYLSQKMMSTLYMSSPNIDLRNLSCISFGRLALETVLPDISGQTLISA